MIDNKFIFTLRIVQESSFLVMILILTALSYDEDTESITEYAGYVLSWVFLSLIILSILCEFIEVIYSIG